MSVPVIAIDGPSASGKGTVARAVADALGFHYLESGALYRLVAHQSLEQNVAPDDVATLTRLAASLPVEFRDGGIFLSGEEVSRALADEAHGERASRIAELQPVRDALLERQRGFRRAPGLVADGRDMGTVVFDDAPLKIFLVASLLVRAQRRHKQLKEKGINASLDILSRDLAARDARDAARAAAPLVSAADAVRIDSSALSVGSVVQRVLACWKERSV